MWSIQLHGWCLWWSVKSGVLVISEWVADGDVQLLDCAHSESFAHFWLKSPQRIEMLLVDFVVCLSALPSTIDFM